MIFRYMQKYMYIVSSIWFYYLLVYLFVGVDCQKTTEINLYHYNKTMFDSTFIRTHTHATKQNSKPTNEYLIHIYTHHNGTQILMDKIDAIWTHLIRVAFHLTSFVIISYAYLFPAWGRIKAYRYKDIGNINSYLKWE